MVEPFELREDQPLIKKKPHNPFAYISGAGKHTGYFLFTEKENSKKNITVTKDGDIIYHNPNYKKSDNPNDQERVVYCIHGTADRANAFRRVAKSLVPQLSENLYILHYVRYPERCSKRSLR